ncbi:acetate/propionate family kinase [Devosia sp.]|uniref:acetate/propionate family kinase n=1 Tax=Devosia sp. TaxID=1871048 RepID=UPI0029303AE4|nr:acetate/propionate family kinase [Devosia sp.]
MGAERARLVLALNAGSSSLKFGLYEIGSDISAPARGGIKRTAGGAVLEASADGETFDHLLAPGALEDDALLERLLVWLAETFGRGEPTAIGHRIVHGGMQFAGPVLLTPDAIRAADALTALAPLHQPAALSLIRAIARIRPQLPQVGCFDTAFHHGLAPPVSRYALPRAYEDKGIRRYGFHGLSYEYLAGELSGAGKKRVVVAHLGSGASLCAMRNGKSQDTTMGFSALDGLVMSTRPGQIDAGVLLYLLRQEKLSPDELEHLLYHESGLKGVSGISGDVRELLASDAPAAAEALDLFVFRIARETAAMANTLEGLDTLVFSGGIGEHSGPIRARVAERLAWLGVSLDMAANAGNRRRISAPSSRVEVLVIPTNEEIVIARQMAAVLEASHLHP